MEKKIQFRVWHFGDPSVGIEGDDADVFLYASAFGGVEGAKKFLVEAFTEGWGFRAYVMTEEEYQRLGDDF